MRPPPLGRLLVLVGGEAPSLVAARGGRGAEGIVSVRPRRRRFLPIPEDSAAEDESPPLPRLPAALGEVVLVRLAVLVLCVLGGSRGLLTLRLGEGRVRVGAGLPPLPAGIGLRRLSHSINRCMNEQRNQGH